MKIETKTKHGRTVASVYSDMPVLTDLQSALDLLISVQYETGCNRICLNKEAVCDDFFVLSTQKAGEILQKFINYQAKLAIYGDYSGYTSKPLQDFIYESNRGSDIFFPATEDQAVELLSSAR